MRRPDKTTTQSVAIEAKRWVVKLDDLAPIEQRGLERWLEESDAHREAFEAAKQEWQSLAFLQQLRNDPVADGDPWVARKRVRRKRLRSYVLPLAAAASIAATALVIGWSLLTPAVYHAEYYTAIGEQQDVSLPDGSSIMLNTSTRLNVQFSDERRGVFLDAGEAHFEVAHDPNRPFVVITSVGLVRAVGTAFTVYVDDEQAEVTVTDGVVEVSQVPERLVVAAPVTELPESRAGSAQKLGKGYNATISDAIEVAAFVDTEVLERKLSWHHGMLEFVNTPLRDVIAEAGRYTEKTLVIEDSELESYPVTVIARTDNIEGLLKNLDISTDAFVVSHVSDGSVLISIAELP